MNVIRFANERMRRLSLLDLKLLQAVGMCIALIFAKIWPEILDVSFSWLAGLVVLLSLRPLYVLLAKGR
ncbi:MAG: hypothetical protein ACE5FH_04680 [Candidatus Zixiibacteriota bacterium]